MYLNFLYFFLTENKQLIFLLKRKQTDDIQTFSNIVQKVWTLI